MKSLLTVLLFFAAVPVFAQGRAETRTKQFNLDHGIALQGYDPVAYFTERKAAKGSKALAVLHQGVTYYFATAANKALFQKSPQLYEPQYGGWCAYAMAKGEKVPVNPETFKIVGNKLYLFYNKFFNNTLKDWNKDEARLKAKADKNWMNFYH